MTKSAAEDVYGRRLHASPSAPHLTPSEQCAPASKRRRFAWTAGQASTFAWGLSYTTFHDDDLAVQAPTPGSRGDIQVTVDVTNTGDRDGDEVAQLYLREDVSSVEAPGRSLKGFTRIHLRAGESRTVTFRNPQAEVAVRNAENAWAVEPGAYTVGARGSSTATLSAQFNLQP